MNRVGEADTVEEIPPIPQDSRSITDSSCVLVEFGALSHPGNVRTNNEDHFLVVRLDRSMQTLLTNVPAAYVPERSIETAYGMLVADGMGGAAAGEVASRVAIGHFIDLVLRTPDWMLRLNDAGLREVLQRMDRRFHQVNAAVNERAQDDPTLAGMGTTLTLACSLGDKLAIVHVGDSRAYLLRQGRLRRLTSDHTVAESLAEVGIIDKDEVATHPTRHMLTNVIGASTDQVRVEIRELRIEDGDQILLCTDGLTDMISDDAIQATLNAAASASETCHTLVELALKAGGKDNATVILGKYRIPEEAAANG